MLEPGTFAALDPVSRDMLSDWLLSATSAVGRGRIDTVLDLSPRPWKVAGTSCVIGVFEPGAKSASWLIVGYGTGWTLAQCRSGSVSEPGVTLAEALEQIDEALGA
jgi:hypothetical protein